MKKLILFVLILCFYGCSEDSPTSNEPDNNVDYGTFVITTIPPGYTILLDGSNTGKITPDSIRGLDPGTYEIGLNHEIYLDTTLTKNLTSGGRVTVDVNLTEAERFYGSINCVSTPSNSLIYLNDSCCSQYTPYQFENIYPGIIEIKYENEGCLTVSSTITLHSGESYYFNKTLTDTMVWRGFNTSNSELPSNNLTCLTCNTNGDGNIWIGTLDAGLAVYNHSTWELFNSSNSILQSDKITELFADTEGNVWIGTDNGFVVYENGGFNPYNEANIMLSEKYITCINETGVTNDIYVATKSEGILIFDISENIIDLINSDNSLLPGNGVNSMYFQGPILLSTDNGLLCDYPRKDLGTILNTGNSEIPSNFINDAVGYRVGMGNYSENKIWINSIDNNVHYLTYYYCYYNTAPVYTTLELDYEIYSIHEIYDPFIWVCSDRGLLKYSESSLIEEITTNNSGILSDVVYDITNDRRGFMWLATDNGLSRYKADN